LIVKNVVLILFLVLAGCANSRDDVAEWMNAAELTGTVLKKAQECGATDTGPVYARMARLIRALPFREETVRKISAAFRLLEAYRYYDPVHRRLSRTPPPFPINCERNLQAFDAMKNVDIPSPARLGIIGSAGVENSYPTGYRKIIPTPVISKSQSATRLKYSFGAMANRRLPDQVPTR